MTEDDGDGSVDGVFEPRLRGQRSTEWLAALAAGGILVGSAEPSAILLASSLPVMAATAFALDAKAYRRRMARGGRVIEIAAQQLDVGVEEIAELAGDSDPRIELLGRVIEAAASTVTLEAKIAALGRVLAQGLRDDAGLDEAIMLVKVLTVLEIPHFRVLASLANLALIGGPNGWHDSAAIRVMTKLNLDATPVMSDLVANGACMQNLRPTDEGPASVLLVWRITLFGRSCLDLLDYQSNSQIPEREEFP